MLAQKKKGVRPIRRLVSLGIVILLLYGVSFVGTLTGHTSMVPGLALDLAGGTQIILSPKTDSGQTVDDTSLDQAIDVIRQRIDSSGVAEAEITKQGTENIVIGIPGETPSQETIDYISKAAKMSFRPVIYSNASEASNSSYYEQLGLSSSAAKSASGNSNTGESGLDDIYKDKDSQKSDDKAKGTDSGYQWLTEDLVKKYDNTDCSDAKTRAALGDGDTTKPLVTCALEGSNDFYVKYLLGPVAIEGTGIDSASSGLKRTSTGQTTNEWVVSLTLKSDANQAFIDTTNRIKELDSPRNQFAITIDDSVISAPQVESSTTFTMGQAIEISGGSSSGFTKTEATNLANQLKFGSLPLSFSIDSKEQISATLGSEQLQKGLIAGLIGLVLVILYSVYQYHLLGLVTIGSLSIAATIIYGAILILSWIQGYRLSLAGVIALIVAIGITADSFIVFFERVRDELRDGRPLSAAVSRGWHRGFRTIAASNLVNFIAAFVLYFLAVGDVRGFAFTLGLTTLVDFMVVILFTCPVITLLAKRPFFYEGHPASGLSPHRLGAANAEQYKKRTKEEKKAFKEERKAAIARDKELLAKKKADEKRKKQLAKQRIAAQQERAKFNQKKTKKAKRIRFGKYKGLTKEDRKAAKQARKAEKKNNDKAVGKIGFLINSKITKGKKPVKKTSGRFGKKGGDKSSRKFVGKNAKSAGKEPGYFMSTGKDSKKSDAKNRNDKKSTGAKKSDAKTGDDKKAAPAKKSGAKSKSSDENEVSNNDTGKEAN